MYDRWKTGKCRGFFFDFLALVGLLPAGDMYNFLTLGGRTYDSQVTLRGMTNNIRGDGQLTLGGTDS